MPPTRIAVIGAGLIGRKHLGILKEDPAFEVAGIADPAPQAEAYARDNGFPYFKDIMALLDTAKPDGVVIANPNALHRDTALACIARGVPAIVEKPVADTLAVILGLTDRPERQGGVGHGVAGPEAARLFQCPADDLDRVGHTAEFGVLGVTGDGGQPAETWAIIRGAVILHNSAVGADLVQRQLEAVFAAFQPSLVAKDLPS